MPKLLLNTYKNKVKGCYVGKAVGGTLGMKLEGFIGTTNVTYYDPVPTEMIANDDLDNQVVWLEAVKRYGLPINRYIIGNAFNCHIVNHMDEYATCVRNIKNGINPPLSGYYDSKFTAGMGAAIRTEIWACLAPGDPKLASKLAREDSCVDHYEDGVDAAMFIAAVESAAFFESDPWKLVHIGLSVISSERKLTKAVNDVKEYVKAQKSIFEIRELILKKYFDQNWTNVIINISFIVAALLTCNGDISKALCDVVSLGHDADCTGATLGSILGIINPDGFEERWLAPLGDDLVISSGIVGIHEANTITEFSEQIIEICPDVLDFYNSETSIDGLANKNILSRWAKTDYNQSLSDDYNPLESVVALSPITVKLDYPKNVAIAPGKKDKFKLRFSHPNGEKLSAKIHLCVPFGWSVSPKDFEINICGQEECAVEFSVIASSDKRRRRSKNPLDIHIETDEMQYVLTAGLVQTFDWIKASFASSAGGVEKGKITGDIEIINSYAHYFSFEGGEQIFATEFRAPYFISEVIMVPQGTRAMKVWIDDKLVLEHDGGEYVPCFHRSEYVKRFPLSNKKWHRLTIWVDEKNYDGTGQDLNPHNSIVLVPGSLSTPEYRKAYEDFSKNDRKGEIFVAFAERSGYHWIDNMQWRLPQDNKFFN